MTERRDSINKLTKKYIQHLNNATYSPSDIARYFCVTQATIYKWIGEETIPTKNRFCWLFGIYGCDERLIPLLMHVIRYAEETNKDGSLMDILVSESILTPSGDWTPQTQFVFGGGAGGFVRWAAELTSGEGIIEISLSEKQIEALSLNPDFSWDGLLKMIGKNSI